MLRNLLPAWVLMFFFVSACNNHDAVSTDVSAAESGTAATTDTTAGNSAAATTPPAGKFRLNPPHGQPGHTCDVPEGSPISNAPASLNALPNQVIQAPSPQPISNPATTAVSSAPLTPQPTPAGMNPPHGQPGHRCDIAVGAPLNSKPSASQKVTKTQTLTPAVPATAAGMNPAHGQPGHRCDIAVGAPLNSKPAAAPAQITGTPPPVLTEKKDSSMPLQ